MVGWMQGAISHSNCKMQMQRGTGGKGCWKAQWLPKEAGKLVHATRGWLVNRLESPSALPAARWCRAAGRAAHKESHVFDLVFAATAQGQSPCATRLQPSARPAAGLQRHALVGCSCSCIRLASAGRVVLKIDGLESSGALKRLPIERRAGQLLCSLSRYCQAGCFNQFLSSLSLSVMSSTTSETPSFMSSVSSIVSSRMPSSRMSSTPSS